MNNQERSNRTDGPGNLGEIGRLFLRLGIIGFGGPAAHIALMRDEVVRRRGWLDDSEFLDLVGATNLIPGPNSTELAIHLGHQRAGGRGLVVAGLSFIAPAVVVVGVLAWLYERHGTDPMLIDLRYGVLPVIVAIIAHAVVALGRVSLVSPVGAAAAAAALAGFLAGVHELLLLVAAGSAAALWANRGRLRPGRVPLVMLLAGGEPGPGSAGPSLWRLLLVFLEIGSILYGSGYVLVAYLQRNLVDDRGWLSEQELLDAVSVGQVTPGPVFTTATFVGWQIDGWAGAAVATVGIFAPSFLFVALLGRIVPWLRTHATARAFLDGVVAASLGMMAGVLVDLVDDAISDLVTAAVAAGSLAVLVATRLNSAWLIGGGVMVGLAHRALA